VVFEAGGNLYHIFLNRVLRALRGINLLAGAGMDWLNKGGLIIALCGRSVIIEDLHNIRSKVNMDVVMGMYFLETIAVLYETGLNNKINFLAQHLSKTT
jgi:hypothetical protein